MILKRFLISAVIAMASLGLYGQFSLTPSGFVNAQDDKLDYYVFEFPGKSKQQLFRSALAYLTTKYSSQYDAFNLLEPEMISLNGFGPQAVVTKPGIFGVNMDLWFNMQVEFKDGRMRIMRPVIRNITQQQNYSREITETHQTKDKDGKVIRTDEKKRNVPATKTVYLYVSPFYADGDGRFEVGDQTVFNRKDKLKLPYAKETLEEYINGLVYNLCRQMSGSYEDW